MLSVLVAASHPVTTAKPVSATSLLIQLLVGLAVVLALIWVASRVARGRIAKPGVRRRGATLAVVSRQPLGKGVQVAVVKAGREMYLLGVTAHQVTRLARFGPDQAHLFDPGASPGPVILSSGSSDDLPPGGLPDLSGAPTPFRLNSTIRQLQEKTLRKP
ncbi:MAG: FliO/MopB family protein [Acidobacteriota bacterium]|nr:FliO/MopB family protein [Acidobacteriota bacterium]